MKKYFFLLLSVVLFAACSNDDDPAKKDEPGKRPEKVAEYDLTDMLSLDAQGVEKKWGEAVIEVGEIKGYEFSKGSINKTVVIFNAETNLVYSIVAVMDPEAYTVDEVEKYFASWLTKIEQEGETFYVNNSDYEKATIAVSVNYDVDEENGETYFTIEFYNPQNQPETPEGGEALIMDADEIYANFMDADIDVVLGSYPCFAEYASSYYAAAVEDELVSFVALTADESGVVRFITLLYENAEDDEAVIAYYRNLGFNIIDLGEDTEDGEPVHNYLFQGDEYLVQYADMRGVIISDNAK